MWNSPTFTTWGSIGTRFLSFVLVLPLLLRQFSPAELSLWWLFSTIISLQALADLGFAPTFIRLIAYGMGGARSVRNEPKPPEHGTAPSAPNWSLVSEVWATMRTVYARLTVIATLPLALLGTWALVRPIGALDQATPGWASWGITLAVSAVTFWGGAYAAYLQGVNQVALLRRWEALSSIGTTLTYFLVLLLGGRLLALVISAQAWSLFNLLRNWQLARIVNDGRLAAFPPRPANPEVLQVAWPAAWRSGVGIAFSRGVLYASGLVYAQVAEAAALSTYLLAFRWIQLISELSQAPFYSKIPQLSRLRSEGRFAEQLAVGQRGMRLAYWTYTLGFVILGLAGSGALEAIGSRVAFADSSLWILLGLGFFVERYGAMHIQLYSTTNHIIWHVANGVTGTVYLAVSLALLGKIGVLAFPVAILVGYLGFYSWYAALHDYRLFQLNFWRFERTVALPPAIAVVVYSIAAWLL